MAHKAWADTGTATYGLMIAVLDNLAADLARSYGVSARTIAHLRSRWRLRWGDDHGVAPSDRVAQGGIGKSSGLSAGSMHRALRAGTQPMRHTFTFNTFSGRAGVSDRRQFFLSRS